MFQCGYHNQNIIWTRLIYHTIPPPIKTAPPTIGNRAPVSWTRIYASLEHIGKLPSGKRNRLVRSLWKKFRFSFFDFRFSFFDFVKEFISQLLIFAFRFSIFVFRFWFFDFVLPEGLSVETLIKTLKVSARIHPDFSHFSKQEGTLVLGDAKWKFIQGGTLCKLCWDKKE